MEWQEANSEYHDQLVNSYREEITPMLAEYISSLPEGIVYVVIYISIYI